MELLVLTTGGSIDKTYSAAESSFVVGVPAVRRVLSDANVTLGIEVRELFRRDSLNISEEDRHAISREIRRSSFKRVVVTHGTDSIVETARFLEPSNDRTIVLTGAMRPADFRKTDAEFNLGAAIAAVQILPEGVYIVMNGRILTPAHSRKNPDLEIFEEI
jgi:L-asparaginase